MGEYVPQLSRYIFGFNMREYVPQLLRYIFGFDMGEYVPQLLRYIFGFSAVAEKMHDDGEEDGNVMKEHSDMDNMGYEVKLICNHIIDAIATLVIDICAVLIHHLHPCRGNTFYC